MKKNKMKMMAVVLILTISSMFIAPKKSEAGIILVATGGTAGVVTAGYILTGLSVTPAVLGLFDSSHLTFLVYMVPPIAIPLFAALILDADGSLPSDKLVSELSKKYSFIENKEVIENLVSEIKEKAGKLNVNEKKFVSFSSSEIDSVLSSMDTTGLEKEITQMKKDLE